MNKNVCVCDCCFKKKQKSLSISFFRGEGWFLYCWLVQYWPHYTKEEKRGKQRKAEIHGSDRDRQRAPVTC